MSGHDPDVCTALFPLPSPSEMREESKRKGS